MNVTTTVDDHIAFQLRTPSIRFHLSREIASTWPLYLLLHIEGRTCEQVLKDLMLTIYFVTDLRNLMYCAISTPASNFVYTRKIYRCLWNNQSLPSVLIRILSYSYKRKQSNDHRQTRALHIHQDKKWVYQGHLVTMTKPKTEQSSNDELVTTPVHLLLRSYSIKSYPWVEDMRQNQIPNTPA